MPAIRLSIHTGSQELAASSTAIRLRVRKTRDNGALRLSCCPACVCAARDLISAMSRRIPRQGFGVR